MVKDAHSRKLIVGSYVVNTTDHLQEALDLGVDAIVTDYPAKIVRALEKMGLRNRDNQPFTF
jgi:glycerophosphoryl diester phosphodiesterase